MLTCGSVTDFMVQRELACAIHTQTHSLTNMPSDPLQKERENQCVFHKPLQANESHSLHQPATKTLYTSSKHFIPNHICLFSPFSSHHMQMIVLNTIKHSFRGQVHSSSSITANYPVICILMLALSTCQYLFVWPK